MKGILNKWNAPLLFMCVWTVLALLTTLIAWAVANAPYYGMVMFSVGLWVVPIWYAILIVVDKFSSKKPVQNQAVTISSDDDWD